MTLLHDLGLDSSSQMSGRNTEPHMESIVAVLTSIQLERALLRGVDELHWVLPGADPAPRRQIGAGCDQVHVLRQQLPALTRGEGVLDSAFDHYQPAHGTIPTGRGQTTTRSTARSICCTSCAGSSVPPRCSGRGLASTTLASRAAAVPAWRVHSPGTANQELASRHAGRWASCYRSSGVPYLLAAV